MKFTIEIDPRNVELANNLLGYERTKVQYFEAEFETSSGYENGELFTFLHNTKYHILVDAYKNDDQIMDIVEKRFVGYHFVSTKDFEKIYRLREKTFIVNLDKQQIDIQ